MKVLENKIFNSRIKSEDVSKTEVFLGYLLGPSLAYLMMSALSGNYLMQFYTDVIGVSGTIFVLMPIISKVFSSIASLLISKAIDNTNSVQGKARPWVFISCFVLSISGILLYAIPKASQSVQIIWILFSYNLFFVIAHNIYQLSHTLMLHRSTRNSKSRDKLSLMKNISEAMIPGTLSAVIMPLLINRFGVGVDAQSNWFRFMVAISLLALPGCLLEYYFTKERVNANKTNNTVPFSKQIKDCLRHSNWVLVIVLFTIKSIDAQLSNNIMVYYSNWVLADSVGEGSVKQVLLNVVGQFPLGPGILLLMPLVKKIRKTSLMKYGYLLVILGCLIVFLNPGNTTLVLVGMFIKSIGSLPVYLSASLLSDTIDRFEEQYDYRCDALSISITSIIGMIGQGLAQSVILLGINTLGYIAPSSTEQIIVQNDMIKGFFNFVMSGIPAIGSLAGYLIVSKLDKIIKNINNKKQNSV